MRIAIFSDIHGNREALKAIINDIKKENIDEIICLGDVLAIGPNPSECVDLIIKNNIKMILGNHDLYLIRGTGIDDEMEEGVVKHELWVKSQINERQKEYLRACPLFIEKDINGKKILFTHFPIEDINNLYPWYDLDIVKDNRINEVTKSLNYDLVFIGHEHNAFSVDNKLFCVGTSGCRKEATTIYTILDTNDFSISKKTIPFDWDGFINDLNNKDYFGKEIISEHFYGIKLGD